MIGVKRIDGHSRYRRESFRPSTACIDPKIITAVDRIIGSVARNRRLLDTARPAAYFGPRRSAIGGFVNAVAVARREDDVGICWIDKDTGDARIIAVAVRSGYGNTTHA